MLKKRYFIFLFLFLVFIPFYSFAMELNYFDKDIKDVLSETIKVLLLWTGRITLLFLILSGVVYVISGANPELQQKAKKAISYSIFGLIFILSSYAIIVQLSVEVTGIEVSISNASVSPPSAPFGSVFIIKAKITSVTGGIDSSSTLAYIHNSDDSVNASIILYDDATNGDLVAGDGNYTNDWNSGIFPPDAYFVDISACNIDGKCSDVSNI